MNKVLNVMLFMPNFVFHASELTIAVKKAMGKQVADFQWKDIPLNKMEVEVAPKDTPATKDGNYRVNVVIDSALHHKANLFSTEVETGICNGDADYNDLCDFAVIIDTGRSKEDKIGSMRNQLLLDTVRLVLCTKAIRYIECSSTQQAGTPLARKLFDQLGFKPQVNTFPRNDWDGSY